MGEAKSDRPHLALPSEPSDEELARDWTLSEADHEQVRRCRGDGNRLRFAVQLCALRTYGRFVNNFVTVPVGIANYLGRQLDLPPVLFVEPPEREATDLQHEERIREYLGFRSFDGKLIAKVERWLQQRAVQGTAPTELVSLAEGVLRSWKIVLPARSTLERMARSVATGAQKEIFRQLETRLGSKVCKAMDELLEVSPEKRRSTIFHLREYPPEATPISIASYIDRLSTIETFGVGEINLGGLDPGLVERLAQTARTYDVARLKRFAAPKRHALVACFLVDAHKTIADHVIEMNHQFLTGMSRRSRHAFEARHRAIRRRAKKGLDVVIRGMEILLDPDRDKKTLLEQLFGEINESELRAGLDSCRDFQRLEERGFVDELLARHHQLMRYFYDFLDLVFEAEPGSESLLAAIELARRLKRQKKKTLPPDVPTGLIPASWRKALPKHGPINRQLWEVALAFAVRDGLRSGDLYLPQSRQHLSFWNLVYDQARWRKERDDAYVELGLPSEAQTALDRLRDQFNDSADRLSKGLDNNRFATIQDGKLKLKRRDALDVPDGVRDLRRLIEMQLPRVRIEELLLKVDSWCRFTREFRLLGDQAAPS